MPTLAHGPKPGAATKYAHRVVRPRPCRCPRPGHVVAGGADDRTRSAGRCRADVTAIRPGSRGNGPAARRAGPLPPGSRSRTGRRPWWRRPTWPRCRRRAVHPRPRVGARRGEEPLARVAGGGHGLPAVGDQRVDGPGGDLREGGGALDPDDSPRRGRRRGGRPVQPAPSANTTIPRIALRNKTCRSPAARIAGVGEECQPRSRVLGGAGRGGERGARLRGQAERHAGAAGRHRVRPQDASVLDHELPR